MCIDLAIVDILLSSRPLCWGVAKLVRHGTLTPARVGSSPAAPATSIKQFNKKQAIIYCDSLFVFKTI